MRKVDYWVEVEDDETTGETVYNIRSALALGKKMAKKYNKRVFIQKFKLDDTWGMIPADFDYPSYYYIEPDGTISEH